jgi:hypothetical protein
MIEPRPQNWWFWMLLIFGTMCMVIGMLVVLVAGSTSS